LTTNASQKRSKARLHQTEQLDLQNSTEWEVNYLWEFCQHYGDAVAVYSISPVELISGELPRRQQRMVEAWAELHQEALLEDWTRLQAGQLPQPIAPLQ